MPFGQIKMVCYHVKYVRKMLDSIKIPEERTAIEEKTCLVVNKTFIELYW